MEGRGGVEGRGGGRGGGGGAGEGGRRKRMATTHMFFDDSDEDGETPAKRRECSWSAALYNSVR